MRILLQSVTASSKNGRELGICTEQKGSLYNSLHFHSVDLDGDFIRDCLPSLVRFTWGYIVSLAKSIYIFGGMDSRLEENPDFKILQSRGPKSYEKFYMGAARIDFDPDNSQGAVWGPAPTIRDDRFPSNCSALLGKVYNFGLYLSVSAPDVFDPAVGHWQRSSFMPSELSECMVNHHPLPDPTNHRFFVHLEGGELSSPSLYTFKPLDKPYYNKDGIRFSRGKWELVESKFYDWTGVGTLLEGVMYFQSPDFPSNLKAFHVATRKWLNVSWASAFENNVNLDHKQIEFDALLSLGDMTLCLAGWLPIHEPTGGPRIQVFFYKFRVDQSDDVVRLIPLSFHSYELPDADQVVRFLPV